MRLWLAFVLFAGCGSSDDGPDVAMPGRHTVVDPGDVSNGLPAPTVNVDKSCRVEQNNGSGTLKWLRESYEDPRRPLWLTVMVGASEPVTREYEYDALGRPVLTPDVRLTYEGDTMLDSANTRYVLDGEGRVLSARDAAGTDIVRYAYDGDLLTAHLEDASRTGNPLNRHYEYDAQGFLAVERSSTATTTCERTWSWTHGIAERVSVRDGSSVHQTCTYEFDESDRLTSASCGFYAASWTYRTDATVVAHVSGGSATFTRITGDCDLATKRKDFARLFAPTANDPRPPQEQRLRLAADVPVPSRECEVHPFF